MKKYLFLCFILIALLISGCAKKTFECEDFCGDGMCDSQPCTDQYCPCQEDTNSCPTDCL